MHPLDVGILLGFVAYALWSGARSRGQASRGLEEYFLAGRSLSGTQAGLSMAATQFSADTPLLVTGLIATRGVFSLWRLWVYALAFLLLGFVLAPCWRRAGVLTDAELAQFRYDGRYAALLRSVKALYFGVVFNCAVLAMVLFAAGRIAEPFLRWHAWLPGWSVGWLTEWVAWVGVSLSASDAAGSYVHTTDNLISLVLILLVAAGYSTTGGLRAVVRTDLLQLALALLGTLLYAVYAVRAAGGLGGLREALSDAVTSSAVSLPVDPLLAFEPSRAQDASLAVLLVLGFQWLLQMNADGTGYLAQRCMACRSDRDATRATVVFTLTQVLLRSLIWIPIGLALLVVLPAPDGLTGQALVADREASFVTGMRTLLPVGLRGLLLTAMLAALASTLDTHLNWGSSYFTNDLFRPWFARRTGRAPGQRLLVRVARTSNFVIVVLALFVMTQLDSIQTAWHVTLLLGAGMGPMLLLRWWWWRISAFGELAAIAGSLLLAPWLLVRFPEASDEAARLLWMAVGSTAIGVGASLFGPPEPSATLQGFFERVRPPGHWAPQARVAGEAAWAPLRRLASGLSAAALTALSIFAALVAAGSWMVGGTPPRYLPTAWQWHAALALTAVLSAAGARWVVRRGRGRG